MTTQLTPEILFTRTSSAGTPVISHDGRQVAFTLTTVPDGAPNPETHIWVIPVEGGSPRKLTSVGSPNTLPTWSPDDRSLAFISGRERGGAICVIDLRGGEATVVTSHLQRPKAVVWSPDGSTLAYTVPVDPDNPDEHDLDPDAPAVVRVTRRADYKQDNRGYLGDTRHQLFTVDLTTGDRQQRTTEPVDHDFPVWSPDGSMVAVKRSTHNGFRSKLQIISLDGTEPTLVGWDHGMIGTWVWKPDSSAIVFSGNPTESPQHEYFRYDLARRDLVDLSNDLPFAPETGFPSISGPAQPVWIDEGHILVHGLLEGRSGAWTVNVRSGDVMQRRLWDATHAGLSSDATGNAFVQAQSDTTGMGRIVISSRHSEESHVLFDPSEEFFAEHPPARVEKITVPRDDWSIDAWIHFPPDFDESRTYPLVMTVHGGPHGHHGFTFHNGAHLLASAGFVVVAANPRGSGTYGRAFGEAVLGDWAGEDWLDLNAVLDDLVSRPYIDERRVGIEGYSYGGFMASFAIGHSDRFRASMIGAPVFNLTSCYGSCDFGHTWYLTQFAGSMRDESVQTMIADRSPHHAIHNATAPTLIAHGEADHRCPIGQSEELFIALLDAGVETEFVRYPGGSHLFLRSGPLAHRIDFYRRMIDWFTTHLGEDASPTDE